MPPTAKILVVDDEEDMRTTLAILLEAEGYTVITAMNGHGAMERLKKEPVDMVVSDIRMPDMDGIELLQQAKAVNPTIPVVMVTGYGSAELAVEAMKLGAFDYLQKPFDNERLYDVVRSALSQASLQRSAAKGGVVEQRLSEKLAPRSSMGGGSPKSQTATALAHHGPLTVPAHPWWWILATLLALGLAGTGWWLMGQLHWGSRAFTIETTNASGLSVEGDNVWLCDWLTQSVMKFHLDQAMWSPRALNKSEVYKLPGRQLTGVTAGEDKVFTCDSIAKKIYEHEPNADLSVKLEVASPGPSPSGVFWDGKYLWSVDAQARKIYKHNHDAALTVINTFDSPGPHPVGLGTDGDTIWSADAETKLLYQHQSGSSFTVVGTFRLPKDTPERLSAFTRTKDMIWIGAEGANNLILLQPRTLVPVK